MEYRPEEHRVALGTSATEASLPRSEDRQFNFVKQRGYIASGSDLLVAEMTVEEATKKAKEIHGCRGFTFSGVDAGGRHEVFFKGKVDGLNSADWTSYILQEAEISTTSNISIEDYDVEEEYETLRQRLSCRRPVRCCFFCGPFLPRWKCWGMCLIMAYILSFPVLFLAIHFVQYPGNWEGDFPIVNANVSDFVASRSDGKHMKGLRSFIPLGANSKQAPVVFFGGNAQGMSGAALDASWLFGALFNGMNSHQFQVFTSAYRGYSPNSGWVSQAALTKDAEDLLDHALNTTHGSLDGRVILGGWSMGAGVASQLAAARPENIAGVALFSPWSTLRQESLNIAAPLSYLLYPYIWLSEVWDSMAAIASLPADIPVAILSAGADQVIPSWEHRKVFDASRALQKWWLQTPGVPHQALEVEVLQHQGDLGKWMQAAWARVEVFAPPTQNATSRPFIAESHRKAFVMPWHSYGSAVDGIRMSFFV